MGILDLFKSKDINKGLAEFQKTNGAVLVNVRTESEFQDGHIRGSINIPLDQITSFPKLIKDKRTPIFVYCRSGNRSEGAITYLTRLGYTNVNNIGGIIRYKGQFENNGMKSI